MLLLAGLGLPGTLHATGAARQVGDVRSASGGVFAQIDQRRTLSAGADVLLGDLVWTEADARAALAMEGGSNVFLGSSARLKIDRFVAASGGQLVLGDGAMIFDRDDALPKTAIEVRSVFGLIGVRGTRFFAGPSRGTFGIFCERGEVKVEAGGETRVLAAGDGVEITAAGAAASALKRWNPARIDEAFRSVLG